MTIATLCRIPQLVIGLTVVAFGTSAPELFVGVSSILQNADDLAVGNVVGSNIFNILVVLGCSALVFPLRVESRLVRRDVPVLLAISSAAWGMASAGRMTWQAGVALLIGLIINTVWEIRTSWKTIETVETSNLQRTGSGFSQFDGRAVSACCRHHPACCGVENLGQRSQLGSCVSEGAPAVISLTIVATGTSTRTMPPFCATLKADDLAVGNIVGSCLLNLLMVLGGCGHQWR